MADTPTATAPQQDQGFDPLGELRKRYPGISQEPDEKLYQHLSNPANFRSAFPEYQHLDDETITRNMTSHAPTEQARQGVVPPAGQAPMKAQTVTPFEKERTPEGALSTPHIAALPPALGGGTLDLNKFWQGLKAFGTDVGGAASGVADMALSGPTGAAARAPQQAADLYLSDQNRKAAGYSPGYRAAAGLATVAGVMDPAAMEESARRGDTAGVVGHTALPLSLAAAGADQALTGGKVLSKAAEMGGEAARPLTSAAAKVAKPLTKAVGDVGKSFTIGMPGEDMLKKGLSPYAKQTGYDAAVEKATNDIVKYHKENPIKSVKDLDEAIPEIQKKIMSEEIEPAVKKHAKEELAPERMARVQKAVEDSISPFTEEFDEAGAKSVKELAEKMGKTRTVGEALGGGRGGLLGYINGQLESYFAKYPSARRSDLMTNPDTAGWAAARRVLREEVLDHLKEAGEPDMAEARARWGGLEELSKTTERRINQADRVKPMSLPRILGLVGAPVTAGLSVVAGEVAHHLNKTDVLVSRGINKMAAKPLTVKAKGPSLEAPPPPKAAIPINRRPPSEVYQRPIEAAPGAGKGAAPHEMHPDELAAIRKEAGDPNMTPEEAHRYRINKTARTAAAAKPLNDLGGMKRAGN